MDNHFETVVNRRTGKPIEGATITVQTEAGAIATIYSDNGVTELANPFTSDADGFYNFYAADGRYTVTISGPGIDTRSYSVLLEDPATGTTPSDGTVTDAALSEADDVLDAFTAKLKFLGGGAGASYRSLRDKLRERISVKDFGAQGDGVADDTAAIVAALTFVKSLGGGEIHFPRGTYKVTQVITIDGASIRITGTGKRGVYPGVFAPGPNTPSTIMPVHAGRCAIRFYSAAVNSINAFSAAEINLATLEAGAVPAAAFGWDCTTDGAFQRDFTFDSCGIHGFVSAFDLYGAGGNTQMGLFKAINCNINRNQWIARTLNGTQWNGFVFRENEAGQNGYSEGQGGISISGHAVDISDNCLEGMRDPVMVSGTYRGVRVSGNYFEECVGRACITLEAVRGPYAIGPNTYLAINDATLDHKVLLTGSCGIGQCLDPYWSGGTHKTPMPIIGADYVSGDLSLNTNLNTASYEFWRADLVTGAFLQEPEYLAIASQRVTIAARDLHPATGLPIPVQEYSTSGAGAVGLSYAISGSAGDWVVMSWPVRRLTGVASADPYVSLNVNGVGAAGSKDYVISQFNTFWRDGEWCLITCAIRLQSAMTSLAVTLSPYGVSPTAGLVSRFLRPVVYTTDNVNKIRPYVNDWISRSTVGDPTVGTWQRGDSLFNAAPSAGGQGTFLCIESGTPGVWVYS